MTSLRWVRPFAVYLFVLVWLLPVLWLLSTSLKTDVEAFQAAPSLIFEPQWGNYADAWQEGNLGRAMANSALVSVVSSIIGIVGGLPLAYLLTQVWEPTSNASRRFTVVVLLLTTVPPVLGLTPLFRTFLEVGLTRNWLGITFVHSFYACLLAILIFRSFLESHAREIREAALVDGCGEWKALLHCILPSLVGPTAAVFVLSLIQSWNEYLYALVLTGGDSQTVPVRIASFLGFMGTNWASLTAAGVIGTLPIVLFALLARNYLARGLSYGGVK